MGVQLPRHVAIIMDGNGRWAEKRHLPRVMGHKAGLKTARMVVETSVKKGIDVLTLFAFGQENWVRPEAEVNALLSLFINSLNSEINLLHENNVRLQFIGELSRFPADLQTAMTQSQQHTQSNTGLTLVLAVNYSGRWDIKQAINSLVSDILDQKRKPDSLDDAVFGQYLATHDLPDPDLLIRSSGECRISNFMLWQLAYTEFYFTNTYWPDFKESDYEQALLAFSQRKRRFGQVHHQMNSEEIC